MTHTVKLSRQNSALVALKAVHTTVWAFFAACILALPVAGWLRRFDWAMVLTALILIECTALALNRGRCPLTNVAEKLTDRRSPNFDIYLPKWLARRNKLLFGSLFAVNELFVLWRRLF